VSELDEMTFAELVEALVALEREDDLGLEEAMARAKIDRRIMTIVNRDAPPTDERRASLRVPVDMSVRLHIGERAIDGRLVDLGEGGVRVHVPAVEAADLLEVELPETPQHPSVRATARISWRRDGEGRVDVGLQFVAQPAGHRRRMRHLVFEVLRRMSLKA
jgi:hypothetical protein